MLATRDKAARQFAEYVKLAKGDSYLVYQALTSIEKPTKKDIENYILAHIKPDPNKKIIAIALNSEYYYEGNSVEEVRRIAREEYPNDEEGFEVYELTKPIATFSIKLGRHNED